MPLVQVQHVAGALSKDQQIALIKDITEAFVRVTDEGVRNHVLVTVSEIPSGLWATGGVPLTIEDVQRNRAERAERKASGL